MPDGHDAGPKLGHTPAGYETHNRRPKIHWNDAVTKLVHTQSAYETHKRRPKAHGNDPGEEPGHTQNYGYMCEGQASHACCHSHWHVLDLGSQAPHPRVGLSATLRATGQIAVLQCVARESASRKS